MCRRLIFASLLFYLYVSVFCHVCSHHTEHKHTHTTGANVNQRNSAGITALWSASYAGSISIVKLLIQNGRACVCLCRHFLFVCVNCPTPLHAFLQVSVANAAQNVRQMFISSSLLLLFLCLWRSIFFYNRVNSRENAYLLCFISVLMVSAKDTSFVSFCHVAHFFPPKVSFNPAEIGG